MEAGRSSAAPQAEPEIVLSMTRVFAAPPEVVFEAWTRPEQFSRWFGPRGTTLPFLEMDPRPGGVLHFCHRHANGLDVWVKGAFHEVLPPRRLVFETSFSDESGRIVERPGYPLQMRVTVTFAARGDGQTEVSLRHEGLRADYGEGEGWSQGLDRLAELLEANE